MKANKPTKNSSSLTNLRLEKSKLLSDLDRLNDVIRETRRTKNPFCADKTEKIKEIKSRVKEIDRLLRENSSHSRGFFKALRMVHHSPKSKKPDDEGAMGGLGFLPNVIQAAVSDKLRDDKSQGLLTGAIRKTRSMEKIDETLNNAPLYGMGKMNRGPMGPNVADWDLSDLDDGANNTFTMGGLSETYKYKHELEELQRARKELREEYSKMCEDLKAKRSQYNVNQTTLAPIYTRPNMESVTSSMPTSYYQTPLLGQNNVTTSYAHPNLATSANQFVSFPQTNIPLSIPSTSQFVSCSNIPVSIPSANQFVPCSQPNVPLSIPNTGQFVPYSQQLNIPLSIPNFLGNQGNMPFIPTTATDNNNQTTYNPFNTPSRECRKSFLKHLDSIPQFAGETREKLMNFIETCNILDKFKINAVEEGELLMKITLQLRGEARSSIKSDELSWIGIRKNLLEQFHYLSNRDILNSKIENLKQEQAETVIQFAERTRKLLAEKNKSYDNLNSDQRVEHDRITRKAFVRGITNQKLREVMRIRGTASLEEAISLTIELENEFRSIIPNRELFCTFCNVNGHRESNCGRKISQDSSMNQMISAMRQMGTQNRFNNTTKRPQQYGQQQYSNSNRNNYTGGSYAQNSNSNSNGNYQGRSGWNNNNNYNNNNNNNSGYGRENTQRNGNGNTGNAYVRRDQGNGNNNNTRNINNIEFEEGSEN